MLKSSLRSFIPIVLVACCYIVYSVSKGPTTQSDDGICQNSNHENCHAADAAILHHMRNGSSTTSLVLNDTRGWISKSNTGGSDRQSKNGFEIKNLQIAQGSKISMQLTKQDSLERPLSKTQTKELQRFQKSVSLDGNLSTLEEFTTECVWGLSNLPPHKEGNTRWCKCGGALSYCFGPLCRWAQRSKNSKFELGKLCPDCICWYPPSTGKVLQGHVMRELVQRLLPPLNLNYQLKSVTVVVPPVLEYSDIARAATARGYSVSLVNATGTRLPLNPYLVFWTCSDQRAVFPLFVEHAVLDLDGSRISDATAKCFRSLASVLVSVAFKVEVLASSSPTLDSIANSPNRIIAPSTSASRPTTKFDELIAEVRQRRTRVLLYSTRTSGLAIPENVAFVDHSTWAKVKTMNTGKRTISNKQPWEWFRPKIPSQTMTWKNATQLSRRGKSRNNVVVLHLKSTSASQLKVMLPKLYSSLLSRSTSINLSKWYARYGFQKSVQHSDYDVSANLLALLPLYPSLRSSGFQIGVFNSTDWCSNQMEGLHTPNTTKLCRARYMDGAEKAIRTLYSAMEFVNKSNTIPSAWVLQLSIDYNVLDAPAAFAVLDADLAEFVSQSIFDMAAIVVVSGGSNEQGVYGQTSVSKLERKESLLYVSLPKNSTNVAGCNHSLHEKTNAQLTASKGIADVVGILCTKIQSSLCGHISWTNLSRFQTDQAKPQYQRKDRCVASRALPSVDSFFADGNISEYSPAVQFINYTCPGSYKSKIHQKDSGLFRQPHHFSVINKRLLRIDHEVVSNESCTPLCWWTRNQMASKTPSLKDWVKCNDTIPKYASAGLVACGRWLDAHILPLRKLESPAVPSVPKPSILILELDSVSREAATKFLSGSVDLLRHGQFKWHSHSEHTYHNTVGPNSMANQVPLLSGCTLVTADTQAPPGFHLFKPLRNSARHSAILCHSSITKSESWLHMIAKKNHYKTAFLEEFCYHGSPFVPQGNFFNDSCIDYTDIGSLFCGLKYHPEEVQQGSWMCFDKGMCDSPCVGSESVQNLSLKRLIKLWSMRDPSPIFAYYNSAAAHSYLDMPWRAERLVRFDTLLKRFLKSFMRLQRAKNTLLILKSDHGAQKGLQLYNIGAQYEQRQPLLHLMTPIGMNDIAENIMRSSKSIVTPYDLYTTMNHIMRGSEAKGVYGPPWAVDLVKKKVPLKRTCKQAAIPPDFCACENENANLPSEETDYFFVPLRMKHGTCDQEDFNSINGYPRCAAKSYFSDKAVVAAAELNQKGSDTNAL